MNSKTVPLLFVALGSFIGFASWRYLRHPDFVIDEKPSKVSQSTTLPAIPIADMSIKDAGPLAGPEFADLRQSYLRNLEFYKTLPVVPLSTDPHLTAKTIKEIVLQGLMKDDNRSGMKPITAQGVNSLLLESAITLSRAAGMSLDDYSVFIKDSRLTPPIGYADAGGGTLQHQFEELYKNCVSDSPNCLKSICLQPEYCRIAVQQIRTVDIDKADIMFDRLNPNEIALFRGMVSHGSLVFHQSPDTQVVPFTSVCTVFFIVEDVSGDRYPFWMSFQYNEQQQKWWLNGAAGQVSARLAKYERFAY